MLGGHWDFGPNLTTVGNGSQSMLLSSKALWRQGFLRCPEYCSQDTPSTDCTCSCPESLREEAFGESVSTTARERRRVEPRDAVVSLATSPPFDPVSSPRARRDEPPRV